MILNFVSQGYLDIVRFVCETGGAAAEVDSVRGVDARSKGGWTPLSELHDSIRIIHTHTSEIQ
jgi:hypothetical protein